MMKGIIEHIEDWEPEYRKYLWEKIRKEVPNIDACSSWIYSDGYYGPCYYDLEENEITGVESDKIRNYCLDQISKAIGEIDDYIITELCWFDEDQNELEEPIEYEAGRIDSRDIAEELFNHVVKIYGGLP
ncbi:MAG TPA: hypothetical protein VGA67_02845 [Candidatus Dojkabacteria bacterium]